MSEHRIYTDGSCHPNPGPGGWAVVYCRPGWRPIIHRGGELDSTNNRMEMRAAIEAMKLFRELGLERGEIISDSKYVLDGITKWMHDWRTNGWRTSSCGPVKNKDLWQVIWDEYCLVRKQVTWRWVKGHAGNEVNEMADAAAAQGRREAVLRGGGIP